MKIAFQIFFGALLFSLVACGNKTPGGNGDITSDMVANNPATASSKGGENHLAVIKFETDTHNFGKISQGEIVTYNFKFKNEGKGPLVIAHASASCGCTVPDYSNKPVQPGEVGYLTVTFNSENKEGPVEKTVTVEANTIPERTTVTILADIHKDQ